MTLYKEPDSKNNQVWQAIAINPSPPPSSPSPSPSNKAPGQPQSVGGTAGSTTWSATWLDGTVGIPEETYTLKCVAAGGGCAASAVGQVITGIVRGVQAGQVTGLPSNTTSSCYVIAVNTISAVCSAPLSVTTTVAPPQNKAPGPPTNVGNTVTGTTWNATWTDGTQGTPTETYTARCVASGAACDASSSHEVSVQRGVQKADVTGLTAGAWTCFVVSTNSVGSSCSGPVNLNIVSNVAPGAPTKVGGTTVATGQWLATWTDGSAGVPVETYSVKCVASGQSCSATAIGIGGTNIPRGIQSGQVTGLSNGASYSCYVIASNSVNAAVCSDPFAITVSGTPAGAAGAPIIISSVGSGTGTWSATWNPGTQGTPLETYSTKCVFAGLSCTDVAQGFGQTGIPRGSNFGQVSGLNAFSAYYCYVIAVNAVASTCSAPAVFQGGGTPSIGTPPGPAAISAVIPGSTSISISFVPGVAGNPLESYQISCYAPGTFCPSVLLPLGDSVFTQRPNPSGVAVVQALTPSTSYTCYVIASNQAGRVCSQPIVTATNNQNQIEGNITPPKFSPVLSPGDLTSTTWLAKWSKGIPYGNPPPTYVITCFTAPTTCTPGMGAGAGVQQTSLAGALSMTFTGLSAGTAHTCYMYASNAGGFSLCSTPVTVTTLTLPAPASTVALSGTIVAGIQNITWSALAPGVPLETYQIQCYLPPAVCTPTGTPAFSSTATYLRPNTTNPLTMAGNVNTTTATAATTYNCYVVGFIAGALVRENVCSSNFATLPIP